MTDGWINLRVEPCVGCGYCCMVAPCVLSHMRYGGGHKTCPGLHFEGGRFWCLLARDSDKVKEHLYIGEGCSSSLCNSQRDAFLRGEGEAYLRHMQKKEE